MFCGEGSWYLCPSPEGLRRGRLGDMLAQEGEADLGGETSLLDEFHSFTLAGLNPFNAHVIHLLSRAGCATVAASSKGRADLG